MDDFFVQITQLQSLFHTADPNLDLIGVAWARFKDEIKPFSKLRQFQDN